MAYLKPTGVVFHISIILASALKFDCVNTLNNSGSNVAGGRGKIPKDADSVGWGTKCCDEPSDVGSF